MSYLVLKRIIKKLREEKTANQIFIPRLSIKRDCCLVHANRLDNTTQEKHTFENRLALRHSIAFLYQEHFLTLDMCKDRCTVTYL